MSVPATRSLPVVLRALLNGDAPLRLLLAQCGAALPDPERNAYQNVVVNGTTLKVPKLNGAQSAVGGPAYLLARDDLLLYVGSVAFTAPAAGPQGPPGPQGPTGATGPQGPAGVLASYGTTLPASPADGAEAVLVDSVTNPSYQWRFRFNAGSSSPYKWECVGGTDARAYVATSEAFPGGNGTWQNLTTPGPLFTVPRAGDYDAFVMAQVTKSKAELLLASVEAMIGDAVAGQYTGVGWGNSPASVSEQTVINRAHRHLAVAAGAVIKTRYYAANASGVTPWAAFQNRELRVRPVRVA